jgi:GT2 family glycosyltransferase/glycosyltransferase involved in cell wall biosynthesis
MGITQGKASIIILTYNGLNYTRQCLDSLFTKTHYPEFEVILVDNASQDGTPDYLQEVASQHANVNIILNHTNQGFAAGNNIGAFTATGEYLVFLNNDTIVTENWLAGLISHLQDQKVGMVGPVTNAIGNESRILCDYEKLEDMDDFARRYTQAHQGETSEIDVLAFMCVALRLALFHEVGPLDERFGIGMFEDDDYAIRIRQKGYKLICAEDVFIHHWGGGSFLKLEEFDYWQLFRENRQKFENKWGISWQPHHLRQEQLRIQVDQLSETVFDLAWRANVAESHLRYHESEIKALKHYINEVQHGTAWNLAQNLLSIRLFFIPEGSQRERILLSLKSRLRGESAGQKHLVKEPQPPADNNLALQQTETPKIEVNDRQVFILAPQFFNFEGSQLYLGGAERYLVELAKLVQKMGYQPLIYQSGTTSWERQYEDIPVMAIETGGNDKALNLKFHKMVPTSSPVIYLAFILAAPHCHPRSIGISHGVFWDKNNYSTMEVQAQETAWIIAPLTNLSRVVSVDTNTINWVRTVQAYLSEKFVYIPNFVDPNQFHPSQNENEDKLVILYPRRLYRPRGFWLVKEIIPDILGSYPNLEFYFVGQAEPQEESIVQELVRQYPGQVTWETLPMAEMQRAYQRANITLIPTMHSEGTSLSCLEAMACGTAVIATTVGGLPDLIISEYNGLLVEPNPPALKSALLRLVDDQQLRHNLARRSLEVAYTFNLEHWQAKWLALLKDFL